MSLENTLAGFDAMDIDQTGGGGYNYYGFTKPGGAWRILRENVAKTEYRFAVGNLDYSTNFTNRASLNYVLSSALPQR